MGREKICLFTCILAKESLIPLDLTRVPPYVLPEFLYMYCLEFLHMYCLEFLHMYCLEFLHMDCLAFSHNR